MPAPGSLYGDSLNNFNEFFAVMTPYVEAVAKSNMKKLSPAWKKGLQAILDTYLASAQSLSSMRERPTLQEHSLTASVWIGTTM